jgi:hypothetical protein
MGYNRAGTKAKLKVRRRRKEERRLALKAAPVAPKPATGTVAKVKRAATTVAAVAKGVVEGVKEGLASKRPGKKAE